MARISLVSTATNATLVLLVSSLAGSVACSSGDGGCYSGTQRCRDGRVIELCEGSAWTAVTDCAQQSETCREIGGVPQCIGGGDSDTDADTDTDSDSDTDADLHSCGDPPRDCTDDLPDGAEAACVDGTCRKRCLGDTHPDLDGCAPSAEWVGLTREGLPFGHVNESAGVPDLYFGADGTLYQAVVWEHKTAARCPVYLFELPAGGSAWTDRLAGANVTVACESGFYGRRFDTAFVDGRFCVGDPGDATVKPSVTCLVLGGAAETKELDLLPLIEPDWLERIAIRLEIAQDDSVIAVLQDMEKLRLYRDSGAGFDVWAAVRGSWFLASGRFPRRVDTAMDSDGDLHIVWEYYKDDVSYNRDRIEHVVVSAAGESNQTSVYAFDGIGGWNYPLALALDADGDPVVLHSGSMSGSTVEVEVSRLNEAGDGFELASLQDVEVIAFSKPAALAVAQDGAPLVALPGSGGLITVSSLTWLDPHSELTAMGGTAYSSGGINLGVATDGTVYRAFKSRFHNPVVERWAP